MAKRNEAAGLWAKRRIYAMFLMAAGIVLLLAAVVADREIAAIFWLAAGTLGGIGLLFGVWQSLLLLLDRFTPLDFDPVMTSVRLWSLLGLAVLLACLVVADRMIDLHGYEAMKRGDAVVSLIRAYREQHGSCPVTPEQIAVADERLRLAFAGADLHVSESKNGLRDGRCYLISTGGLIHVCTRPVDQGAEWTCDD